MYSISLDAQAALRTGATLTPILYVYERFGRALASSEGTPRINLMPDGGITIFRKAAHTRKFECTVTDETGLLVPTNDQRILDPIRRQQAAFFYDIGWTDSTGTNKTERVPAGRFVIEDCTIEEVNTGGVTMNLSGRSRTILIEENPWQGVFELTGPMYYSDAILAIIDDRKPAEWTPNYNFQISNLETIPDMIFSGDNRANPWDEVQKLLESSGTELVDDPVGALILRDIPDPTKLPAVWFYDDSQLSTGLPGYRREIHTANVNNGVIVNGTAPWLLFPIQGMAWDDDPTSPTYYKGPLGAKPKIIDNAVVSTQAAANFAAEGELKNVLGITEEVNFEAIPNPAQDIGDVVAVGSNTLQLPSRKIMFEEIFLPFDVKTPMRGTVQTKRLAT